MPTAALHRALAGNIWANRALVDALDLTRGDTLLVDGVRAGVLDTIVDDAAPECRLYLAAGEVGRDAVVTRASPTAARRLRARSVGTYYAITERPTSGEVVRDDQLAWLAGAAPALVSELAAYKHADAGLRAHAFDALAQRAPLADGHVAATGAGHVFDPLARAQRYAFAAGFTLTRTDAGLRLAETALEAGVPGWSQGAIVDDLASQQLFGPRVDFQCACGKYARMRHRGVVCEVCGVEVLGSRIRAARFAHIALPQPLTPTGFGRPWTHVPVLPAGLRGDARALYLDAAYTALLARPSLATLDEVLHEATRLFHYALLPSTPRFSDYTGAAVGIVGNAVRAPLPLLAEVLRPILYGLCRARGHATSIRDAKQLLLEQPAIARDLIAAALQDRVVLLASPRGPHFVATAIEIGDEPIIELSAELATLLQATSGDEIVLHLPITDAGQAQARRMRPDRAVPRGGWIEALAELEGDDAVTRALTRLAREQAIDACESPRAAFLVGGYASTAADN